MAEQTVIAWFENMSDAEKAKQEIQSRGVETAKIHEIAPYPVDSHDRLMNPITGQIPSLASLTLGAQLDTLSDRILVAASPSANGISGEFEYGQARNLQLTVVCDTDLVDFCVDSMKKHGGLT